MGGKDDIGGYEYIPANQCFAEKSTTPFGLASDMDQMKAMVQNADPATVRSVAQGWAALSKDLVGSGGIKESLDTAVQHVMAHWDGDSAELFKQRAQVISKKITDSSKYADNVSLSLTGAAAVLADVKPQIMAMEKPGKLSSAMDYVGDLGDRDAANADNALKGGATSGEVLASNEGSLSAGREAQLKMAEKMEVLGAAYNSRAKEMGSWTKSRDDQSDDYPGDPGGIAPAPVVVPTGNATRSPQRATAGTAHGSSQVNTISSSTAVTPPSGITGGAHQTAATQPQVGTAIDGISGGRAGAPTIGGAGPVTGGSAGGGHVGAGSGFVGGVAGGAAVGAARAGMAGRAGAGGAGMAGRAGAGGAGMAGRAGVGASGTGTGGAGRVGGTARGGVVGGTPKAGAGAGRGTAGGSGLHNSRGAAGRGASATRKGGMAGVPGSRTGRAKEEEGREGERPDYLVEDEETWAPQTNAAPPVIE